MRGNEKQKLDWIFTLYDIDRDGRISRPEMLEILSAVYSLLGENTDPPITDHTVLQHLDMIFSVLKIGCFFNSIDHFDMTTLNFIRKTLRVQHRKFFRTNENFTIYSLLK